MGEIPSHKIYEDENVVAFLDINPATPGHTLLVTRNHWIDIFDVPEDVVGEVFRIARKLLPAVKEVAGVTAINIVQNSGREAGQIIPHFHVHLVPRFEGDQVMLKLPMSKPDEIVLSSVAEMIRIRVAQ